MSWKNDKVRLHREALKHAWFNMDHSNTPVVKEIRIEMEKYPGRIGQGVVRILKDGPDCYTSFATLQKNPIAYAREREEYKSGEYNVVLVDTDNNEIKLEKL
tara:strand:+ start:243 stop:548 length:306 start_codon:yes stop_codon:yes gene_type:complete